MPSELRHSRQRCLSREYTESKLSGHRLFLLIDFLSMCIYCPLLFFSLCTILVRRIFYFYFSLLFSKNKPFCLITSLSLYSTYLIFLTLVYEKLVDTPSINAERMTSVYQTVNGFDLMLKIHCSSSPHTVALSMGSSRKFTLEFLMINRIDIEGMVIDKFLMRLL